MNYCINAEYGAYNAEVGYFNFLFYLSQVSHSQQSCFIAMQRSHYFYNPTHPHPLQDYKKNYIHIK